MNNVAIGQSALYFNTKGGLNTAVGNNALIQNKTGSYNVAIGESALFWSDLCDNNVAIGKNAGAYSCKVTGANKNTFLGPYTDFDVSTNLYYQSTAIGYGAKITDSNQIVLGTLGQKVSIPGTITLSSSFVTPTAGQLGYRINGTNTTPTTEVVYATAYSLSSITLPVGVWQIYGVIAYACRNTSSTIDIEQYGISTGNIGSFNQTRIVTTTVHVTANWNYSKETSASVNCTSETIFTLDVQLWPSKSNMIFFDESTKGMTRFYAVRIA